MPSDKHLRCGVGYLEGRVRVLRVGTTAVEMAHPASYGNSSCYVAMDSSVLSSGRRSEIWRPSI